LLLVGLFLGLVLWVGWPVTLWAACAGGLAWGARIVARRRPALPAARAIADTLVGVAIGLALVWFVQVALTGIGALAGPDVARGAEARMTAARVVLLPWTHPAIFAASTALTLLLGVTLRARRVGAVAAVGSVLFFGGLAARSGEVRWVTSRRSEASSDLRALHGAQTGLVAMAEVRRKLRGLSAEDSSYLASFLRSTESKKHRAEIVEEKAERLAAHTPEPEIPPPTDATAAEWLAVQRCEAWLGVPEAEGADRAPSFGDLDALAGVARDLRQREADARASIDPLANAVVDAAARRWGVRAWGADVRDLPSADRLVAAGGTPDEPWPVTTRPERSKTSALAEVDASELAFEQRDDRGAAAEWSDPSGVSPGLRPEDTPAAE
jgi:hypothetical protein